jgi:hypothetical protein
VLAEIGAQYVPQDFVERQLLGITKVKEFVNALATPPVKTGLSGPGHHVRIYVLSGNREQYKVFVSNLVKAGVNKKIIHVNYASDLHYAMPCDVLVFLPGWHPNRSTQQGKDIHDRLAQLKVAISFDATPMDVSKVVEYFISLNQQ